LKRASGDRVNINAILAMRHGPQGPCSQGAPNMKVAFSAVIACVRTVIVVQRSLQYARDGQPLRDQQPHFLSCVSAKSRIIRMGAHEHQPISSSLKHLCSARFIINVTDQHDNDRT